MGPEDPRAGLPCRRHGCDACCHGTELSLLDEDVTVLEAAGHAGFHRTDADGYLRLRNRDGRCVFLEGGRCTVYPIRPDGCRTYPAVWWVEREQVLADDVCPHAAEFAFSPGLVLRVLRAVALDDQQALLRRRLRGNTATRSQR